MLEEKLKDVLRFYGHNYYKTVIFHKDDGKMEFWLEELDKKTIPKLTSIIQQEIDEKQIEIDLLKANNKKLILMIDNGLGWKDMVSDNDFSPSPKEKL